MRSFIDHFTAKLFRNKALWKDMVTAISRWHRRRLRAGSACTGTGLWEMCLSKIVRKLQAELGLDIDLIFVYVCEIEPAAIEWLKSARKHGKLTYQFLLEDVSHFSTGHCYDVLSREWIPVDQLQVDVASVGWSCKDFSFENAAWKERRQCAAKGMHTSGSTWHGMQNMLEATGMPCVFWEQVIRVLCRTVENPEPPIVGLTVDAAENSCVFAYHKVNTHQSGLPHRRNRTWGLAVADEEFKARLAERPVDDYLHDNARQRGWDPLPAPPESLSRTHHQVSRNLALHADLQEKWSAALEYLLADTPTLDIELLLEQDCR